MTVSTSKGPVNDSLRTTTCTAGGSLQGRRMSSTAYVKSPKIVIVQSASVQAAFVVQDPRFSRAWQVASGCGVPAAANKNHAHNYL